MRPVFLISGLGAVVVATLYWYTSATNLCPVPVLYRVGSVDERFSVSVDDLRAIAAEAEAIWEGATGRDLFTYDTDTSFTINLIYDERQQRTRTEEEWRTRLDAEEAAYEAALVEIKALAARYESEEASYKTKRTEYETALDEYNAEVEEYNEEGGAPPEVYERLQSEAASLGRTLRELNALEVTLNALATELNAKGEAGNAQIAAYNKEVEEYNAIFGTLETFTQGDYERERINIYKFSDIDELRRVIVHEFGHALGIGHVEDESSVMYYLMTEQNSAQLSRADTAAFTTQCGERETFQTKVRRLIATALP